MYAFNATAWVRNETEIYTSTNHIERYIHIPFQAHKGYANFHFLGVNSQGAWLDANHEINCTLQNIAHPQLNCRKRRPFGIQKKFAEKNCSTNFWRPFGVFGSRNLEKFVTHSITVTTWSIRRWSVSNPCSEWSCWAIVWWERGGRVWGRVNSAGTSSFVWSGRVTNSIKFRWLFQQMKVKNV